MAIDSDGDYVQDGSDKDNNNDNNSNSSDYRSSDSAGGDSDDPDLNISGVRKIGGSGADGSGVGSKNARRRRRKQQRERWEGSVGLVPGRENGLEQGGKGRGGKDGKENGEMMDLDGLREAAAGGERIADSVEGMLEARKRKR